MTLKITLKPNERMIIDGAVVRNAGITANLLIENNVPILREKDIMSEKDADSPCRRIYFVIQLMYLDQENLTTHHSTYWELVRAVVKAAPSVLKLIDRISEHIVSRKYYQALKLAKQLIDYEEEVLLNVRKSVANL